jgi:ABC-type nickel/cobalt efflux system permease component RcnA
MIYEALFGAAVIAAAGLYLLKMAFERWLRPAFRVAFAVVAVGLFTIDASLLVMVFDAHRPHYETILIVFPLGLIGLGISLAGMGIMAWDWMRMQREFAKWREETAKLIQEKIREQQER